MFVYADNAATTALSPTALRTMTAALQDVYGNPSSLHRMGRVAAAALKGARETMAKYLGAKPEEVYFPGCGTAAERFRPEDVYAFHLDKTVDERVILQHLEKQLKRGKPGHLEIEISSTDRTLGTIFGTEITRLHGNTLPDDTYVIHCTGGGGQSFGAFIPKGLTLEVEEGLQIVHHQGVVLLGGGRVLIRGGALGPGGQVTHGGAPLPPGSSTGHRRPG